MKPIYKFLILICVILLGVRQLIPQTSIKKIGKAALVVPTNLKEGDVFFQYNSSPTCEAIKIATHSKFSHCGILLKKNNEWYIFEAIGPVKYTRLRNWIAQGDNNYYEQYRLKQTDILNTTKMHTYAEVLDGKPYDSYYMWDNENIYCSELVWKLYHYAGVDLCATKKLKAYYLDDAKVKYQLDLRYGKNVPLDETIVAPEDLHQSTLLTQVH